PSCRPLPDAPADDVLHVLEVHAVFLGELRLGDASGLPAGTDLAHLLGRQLGAAWRPILDRLRCDVTHRRALRRHGRTAQTSRPPRCSATTRNTASAWL